MENTIKFRAATDAAAQWSPEEWAVRVELAALYRIAAHFRMTDLIFTHITARVPGEADHFLINPYGTTFDEVTAANLVKLDLEGNIVEPTPYEVNTAGFVIHSAIHRARPELRCVWHSHTLAGVAVSAQAEGLLPISQFAMPFYNRIAYHDYAGLAFDPAYCEKLATDLGDKDAMILRNHGLIACGKNVQRACSLMLMLDKACQVQVAAQRSGGELVIPPQEVCEHAARQFRKMYEADEALEWPALLRMIADQEAEYAAPPGA